MYGPITSGCFTRWSGVGGWVKNYVATTAISVDISLRWLLSPSALCANLAHVAFAACPVLPHAQVAFAACPGSLALRPLTQVNCIH